MSEFPGFWWMDMETGSWTWIRIREPPPRCRRCLFKEDDPGNNTRKRKAVTPENCREPRRQRRHHPIEFIPVNLMEKLFQNKPFDSDELVFTPRCEPRQQSPDSPALMSVGVMEKFLNC